MEQNKKRSECNSIKQKQSFLFLILVKISAVELKFILNVNIVNPDLGNRWFISVNTQLIEGCAVFDIIFVLTTGL